MQEYIIIILSLLGLLLLCILLFIRHRIRIINRVHNINNMELPPYYTTNIYYNIENPIVEIANNRHLPINYDIENLIPEENNTNFNIIEYSHTVESPTPEVIDDNSSISSIYSNISTNDIEYNSNIYISSDNESNSQIINISPFNDQYSEELDDNIDQFNIDSDIAHLKFEDIDLDKYVLLFEYIYKGYSRKCNICLENINSGDFVKQTSCLHIYHLTCLSIWHNYNQMCPECRMPTII